MITNTELEQKGNQFPAKVISFKKDIDVLHFFTENDVILELTIVRDSVLKFRYTTNGTFESGFSYAITKYASTGYNYLQIDDNEDNYTVTTAKLICVIAKADLRIKLYDAQDKTLLNEDELGFHGEESYNFGGNIVKMSKISHDGESDFGLGDKPVELNLKG